jgi:hypothetical protein
MYFEEIRCQKYASDKGIVVEVLVVIQRVPPPFVMYMAPS